MKNRPFSKESWKSCHYYDAAYQGYYMLNFRNFGRQITSSPGLAEQRENCTKAFEDPLLTPNTWF